MKVRLLVCNIAALVILLSACSRAVSAPDRMITVMIPSATQPSPVPIVPTTTPVPAVTPTQAVLPDAVVLARQVLAQQLQMLPDDLTVVRMDRVDWPDACLDVPYDEEVCAQDITPGYKIVLSVNGMQYEYHSDLVGGDLRLASAPKPDIGTVVIEWQSSGVPCTVAQIGKKGMAFGACGGERLGVNFTSLDRLSELNNFLNVYASFKADTQAGMVKFSGVGTQKAVSVEQRMIAEWARWLVVEASMGQSGTSYGIALTWQREGGIAGLCDHLDVYLPGQVYATSCKEEPPMDLGRWQMTTAQLKDMYGWIDRFKGFEYDISDAASADGLSTRLVFTGAGLKDAEINDQERINQFASELYNEADQKGVRKSGVSDDYGAARQSLYDFFSYLEGSDYKAAAGLYGGEYHQLLDMNEDLTIDDTAELWERACNQNGYMCLVIKQVVSQEEIVPGEYRFIVEFARPNDSLYVAPGSAGELAGKSQFVYTVKRIYGKYLVMEPPIYVGE